MKSFLLVPKMSNYEAAPLYGVEPPRTNLIIPISIVILGLIVGICTLVFRRKRILSKKRDKEGSQENLQGDINTNKDGMD